MNDASRIDQLQAEVARYREDSAFFWKWVERAIFDDKITMGDALSVLAYYSSAPWNNGRWDVDHKPYAEKFYKAFPKARALNPIDGGGK